MIFDTGQNGGKENVSMILIDYKDRRPLYEQIVEKLSDLMVRGILEQDSQLPSVRSLATELSMNPNTIQRAYAELERQGYIYSVKGRGSFVADNRQLSLIHICRGSVSAPRIIYHRPFPVQTPASW